MADELRGAELRLERAMEHIDALRHEARMFMMELPQAYGHAIPDKAVDGVYIVRAKVFRPPPVRLGVLAADAAHNLRSALDMIAWELALKGEDPPPDDDREVGFPICTNPEAWESRRTQNMIKRIPPYACQIIKFFQPCYRPNRSPRLAVIQAIDNWSKHKANPSLMSFHISRMRVLTRFEIVSFQPTAFEDGDEVCRVRKLEPVSDPEEHFQTEMMCHVAFSKNGPGHGWPLDFLGNAYEEIRDEIVPAFEGFFPIKS